AGATGRTPEARRATDFGFSPHGDRPVFYLAMLSSKLSGILQTHPLNGRYHSTAEQLERIDSGREPVSWNGRNFAGSAGFGTRSGMRRSKSAGEARRDVERIHRPGERC